MVDPTVLSNIISFLNEFLGISSFDDSSNNGLQVGIEKPIKKVGFAVDATMETFREAVDSNCDLLVVHHGISWANNLARIEGVSYERIKFLTQNNLALAAYHLPLDAHESVGNNMQLANLLELSNVQKRELAFTGELAKPLSIQELKEKLNKLLDTQCNAYAYGKTAIKDLYLLSGSGSFFVEDAATISDCIITGDEKYGCESIAKELKMNIIFAGHYETETLGVKALMPLLKEKFNIEVEFIQKA